MRSKGLKAKQPRVKVSFNWTPSTMVTVLILVFGTILIGPKVGDYFAMQTQIAQLKASNDKAKQDLVNLSEEKKRWDDPVFIRSQARNRLFYVVPGEISYLVLDANGLNLSDTSGTVGDMLAKQKNTSNISQSIATTKKDWAKALLQSVLQAGLDKPSKTN
ncbi:MAG: hypothetical protein RIQ88_892 [Actinomycetota bacterium]|jgi:cell division protein FtsB